MLAPFATYNTHYGPNLS